MAGKKEIGITVASTGDKLEPHQVSVTFDEAKLDALLFYMNEKGTSMGDALQEHMSELYRSFVPANARRYLDRNDPEEQKTAERAGMTPEDRAALNAKRREQRKGDKAKQAQTGGPAPVGAGQEEQTGGGHEEGQGLTMGGISA